MTTHSAAFAVVFIALYAAHQVGDHWVQTGGQAARKGLPGWPGRRACAAHVLTLNGTKCAAVLAVALVTGVQLAAWPLAAALVIDAASHYWADRRTTLAALAGLAGKSGFYTLGAPRAGHDDNPSLGTGAYALDQSWHIGWLFAAALIASIGAA
jgi:hypothetical protein